MVRRRFRQIVHFTVAGLLASCAAVNAQVTFEPAMILKPLQVAFDAPCDDTLRPPQPTDLALETRPIDELNKRFHAGDVESIQRAAQYLLDHARCAAGAAGFPKAVLTSFDHTSQFVWLTWIGPDAFDTPMLHRLLVRRPASTAQKLDLPGISLFYEIFLGRSPASKLATVLTSTELPDPVVAQIPAVAEKITPTLFGVVAGALGSVQTSTRQQKLLAGPSKPRGTPYWVTSFRIVLPHERAAITGKSIAKEAMLPAAFSVEADKFQLKKGFQASKCGGGLLKAELSALKAASTSCASLGSSACLDAFDTVLQEKLKTAKDACLDEDEKKGLAAVDAGVREFVIANVEGEVKADVAFANAPLRRFSFGLIAAVAAGVTVRQPRVTLDDNGNLKSDPMPRIMSMVTLNRSFAPYDPTTVSLTRAEQWRYFAGAVLTPDFGMTIGLSYLPVRNFSLNVGVAALLVKSVPESAIGQPPASPTDPFSLGQAYAWFFGAGYAFK